MFTRYCLSKGNKKKDRQLLYMKDPPPHPTPTPRPPAKKKNVTKTNRRNK